MKKYSIISIIIICLPLFLTSLTSANAIDQMTGGGSIYKAQLVEVTPSVDGVLDDPAWEKADKAKMEWESLKNEPWKDSKDFSGVFAAVWKGSFLYIAVQIEDDKISTSAIKPWDKDSLEIYIDVEHHKEKSELYQFLIPVKENRAYQNPDNPFVVWDTKGKICELRFDLGYFLKKGAVIGFGIYYNDADATGHRENQIGWPALNSQTGSVEQLGDLAFEASIKSKAGKVGTTWGRIKSLY